MSRRRKPEQFDASRRDFLWKGACAALTATGIASSIWDLRLINAAAGQVAGGPGGYKALVCIFLFGGNDGNNFIIPTDSRYSNYTAARGNIVLPAVGATGGILPLVPPSPAPSIPYGIHPSCSELAGLFTAGKLAVLCNVGTLLAPIPTRLDYLNRRVSIPPQLFSHNDQQVEWQTAIEDQAPKTGWGGRSADLLYSLNSSNAVSMNISVAGSNIFETGNTINEYNVSTNGAISLNVTGSAPAPAQLQALKDVIAMNHNNLYESAFATSMSTAIADAQALNAAIAPTAAASYWTTPFPTSGLGNQLRMIARLMQAAPVLGHSRQVFFASVGGFDLHSGEGNQVGAHANLLSDLSKCMNALYKSSQQLGIDTGVTMYTASDFSRTFPSNADVGTDHGWGNHQMILGGAVQGGKLYGTYPDDLTIGGPYDTSNGRWIPSTSVEQYAATLAKWFGVSTGNLPSVFPYLARFSPQDLGFMG